MLMMLAWEAIEAQRLFKILFDPGGEPRIFARPSCQPGGQIVERFSQIAAGIKPAQLLQAIVIDFAWYVVQSVTEEMDIATLPDSFGQDFANGRPKPRMIVGDDQFHAVQSARLEAAQKVAPARTAFAMGQLDAKNLAAAVPVDADGNQHGLTDNYTSFAHPLVPGIHNQVRKGFVQRPRGELGQALIQAFIDRADGRRR